MGEGGHEGGSAAGNQHGEEGHIDHRNVHRAAVAAFEAVYLCTPANADALPFNLSRGGIEAGPETRWRSCGRPRREGRTVQGRPRADQQGTSEKRRIHVPSLLAFWPLLDYSEKVNRLKTVGRASCNETARRKELMDALLSDKAITEGERHVFGGLCHETRELWTESVLANQARKRGTSHRT